MGKKLDKRELILDTMSQLLQEGKAGTASVSDIAKKAGIAKGGMYYYFRSKEDVLDALIEREYASKIERCRLMIQNNQKDVVTKIALLFGAYRSTGLDSSLDEYLHMPANAALHQKSLTIILNSLSEIMAGLIRDGVSDGLFRCEHPMECARIFLSSYTFLMDPGLFSYSKVQFHELNVALVNSIEKTLDCPLGTFQFLIP